MKYHFKVKKESNGYSAYCVEIPECHTQGDTKDDLIKNIIECIEMVLEDKRCCTCKLYTLGKKCGGGYYFIPIQPFSVKEECLYYQQKKLKFKVK